MAHRGAQAKGTTVSVLPLCDVCGFVLPRGCATRHPPCDTSARAADEFNKVRKAERPRFESVVRDLGEENAERFLRRYDNAPHASAVIDLLQRFARMPGICDSRARDICLLKYNFLPLAPDHPLFGQG